MTKRDSGIGERGNRAQWWSERKRFLHSPARPPKRKRTFYEAWFPPIVLTLFVAAFLFYGFYPPARKCKEAGGSYFLNGECIKYYSVVIP